MGAVRAGRPSNRRRLPVPHARPREVLRRRRRTHRPRHHDDARAWRVARERRRTADHPRPVHAAGGVHPVGRDGGGLLQIVGAARLLAKLPGGRAWKRRFCSASCSCSSGRPAPGPGVSTVWWRRKRRWRIRHEGTTHGTRHHHGSGAGVRRHAGAMGEPQDGRDSAPAGRQAESHRAGAAKAGGWPSGSVRHLGRGRHDLLSRSGQGPEGRRRAAADAVGGRPSEGTTGSQSRRRSVHLLSPAGRASPEPSQPVQDRADAADDDLSPRIVRRQHVPADLHRWSAAAEAERNRAGLAGIFGRPLGGRRVRRREHRIPRQAAGSARTWRSRTATR